MEIDRSRSRAILIGNSTYRDPRIADLPAAAACITAMAEMLGGDLCDWPADRITCLVDVATPSELARRVVGAVKGVQDTVLVYYVGHGLRTSDGQLALAVSDAEADPESLPHTAILYEAVARILRGCPAATKLVILDCCHAELGTRANYMFQSADLAEAYPVDGLYFIGASKIHQNAKSPLDGGLSYFTSALLGVLRDGIPNRSPWLRLDQIFVELRGRLLRSNLPEPVEAGIRGAHQFPFSRNAAASDAHHGPSMAIEQPRGARGEQPGTDIERLRAMRADMARAEGSIRHGSNLSIPDRDYHSALLLDRRGLGREARELLQSAAWQGHSEAERIMRFLDANPDASIADVDQSIWHDAEQGDVKAMMDIAVLLVRNGAQGVAINFARCAAEAGDTGAMTYLGFMLEGHKPWEAEQWYQRAADAGHPTAAANLRALARRRREEAACERPRKLAMSEQSAVLLVLQTALPVLTARAQSASENILIRKFGRTTSTRGWIVSSAHYPSDGEGSNPSTSHFMLTEQGMVGQAAPDAKGYRLWEPRPLTEKSMDHIAGSAESIYENIAEIFAKIRIDFPNPLTPHYREA